MGHCVATRKTGTKARPTLAPEEGPKPQAQFLVNRPEGCESRRNQRAGQPL